jgi:hypothetical protein
MNWALSNKYNPAKPAKFNIRYNALITALLRVIIRTADMTDIREKTIKSNISKDINLSENYGVFL